MTLLIQRCLSASMTVDGVSVAAMEDGAVVFVGVRRGDRIEDVRTAAEKLCGLRIFPDERGRMDRSAAQTGAGFLLVPNFTLCGDATHGRRPDCTDAAPPDEAKHMFERFVDEVAARAPVQCGVFGADMKVTVVNDGPLCIIYDTRNR